MGVYLVKVNYGYGLTMCEIYCKLTINTTEQRQQRRAATGLVDRSNASSLWNIILICTKNVLVVHDKEEEPAAGAPSVSATAD